MFYYILYIHDIRCRNPGKTGSCFSSHSCTSIPMILFTVLVLSFGSISTSKNHCYEFFTASMSPMILVSKNVHSTIESIIVYDCIVSLLANHRVLMYKHSDFFNSNFCCAMCISNHFTLYIAKLKHLSSLTLYSQCFASLVISSKEGVHLENPSYQSPANFAASNTGMRSLWVYLCVHVMQQHTYNALRVCCLKITSCMSV